MSEDRVLFPQGDTVFVVGLSIRRFQNGSELHYEFAHSRIRKPDFLMYGTLLETFSNRGSLLISRTDVHMVDGKPLTDGLPRRAGDTLRFYPGAAAQPNGSAQIPDCAHLRRQTS